MTLSTLRHFWGSWSSAPTPWLSLFRVSGLPPWSVNWVEPEFDFILLLDSMHYFSRWWVYRFDAEGSHFLPEDSSRPWRDSSNPLQICLHSWVSRPTCLDSTSWSFPTLGPEVGRSRSANTPSYWVESRWRTLRCSIWWGFEIDS